MNGHVQEEQLQRYFDGELEREPAGEVARHLEGCAPCTGRHAALGRLQRAIASDARSRASAIDFDALFARIEQGVRERPAPSPAERAEMRWEKPQRKRARFVWVPLAGGLAAAAALLVFLQQAPAPSQDVQPNAVEPTTRLSGASSEVEQVDFGSKAGTVFDVMLGDDVSTPVVWIDDGDDEP